MIKKLFKTKQIRTNDLFGISPFRVEEMKQEMKSLITKEKKDIKLKKMTELYLQIPKNNKEFAYIGFILGITAEKHFLPK